MRLVSLTLIACERLLVNNIRVFTLTPASAVQIILGTNGSGKSSIIRLLTPLAADASAFAKDGAKIAVFIKNGSTYICKSTFSPSTKHSFSQDGIELNEGGTERVQNELVKEHFGITPMIHELMLGEEKFHEMTPQRRRIWFTLLCDSNYDFAMKAYETIRERHRDIAGALKMNNKNLVVETAKIISPEEENRLEVDVKALLDELNLLMAERAPLDRPVQHYANSRDATLKELENLSMRLLRTRIVAPLEYTQGKMVRDDWGQLKRATFGSLQEIDDEIDRLKHAITAKETAIGQSTEHYHKLLSNYEILMKAGIDGVQSLTHQHHELDLERNLLMSNFVYHIANPLGAREALESIETSLIDLLNALPLNENRRFGKDRLRDLQSNMVALENEKQACATALQHLIAKRDHADEHRNSGKAVCPQCTHSFVVGIREDQYKLVVEQIAESNKQLTALDQRRSLLTEDIKEIESYFIQYREYIGFTRNVNILESLWSAIACANHIAMAPKEAIKEVRRFKRELETAVKAEQLRVKMEEIVKLREAAEQVGDTNIQEVKDNLETLTAQLGEMTSQVTGLHHAVSEYSDYRRQISQGQAMAEQIKLLYAQAGELQSGYIEATRLDSIAMCISHVQKSLALKQESLRHIKMQKTIVEGLIAQVKRLAVEEEATKMMSQALSPTHGLIAEGLLGFIRIFTEQMNAFVNSVWVYPLKIIPTGYNEGEDTTELDYKFKMLVGHQRKPVKDVGLGSNGQREIINLAFKMGAIHHLNLSAAPLFLDEFGTKLDETHRAAATAAIKMMMNHRDFTQLFMISHYAEVHEGFANAETCVLDRSNITLRDGKVYNAHVTIN